MDGVTVSDFSAYYPQGRAMLGGTSFLLISFPFPLPRFLT